jgi:hypothetical protein
VEVDWFCLVLFIATREIQIELSTREFIDCIGCSSCWVVPIVKSMQSSFLFVEESETKHTLFLAALYSCAKLSLPYAVPSGVVSRNLDLTGLKPF